MHGKNIMLCWGKVNIRRHGGYPGCGKPHFMQRVGLATADKSTWDGLHLVETTFERLKDSSAYTETRAPSH